MCKATALNKPTEMLDELSKIGPQFLKTPTSDGSIIYHVVSLFLCSSTVCLSYIQSWILQGNI